MQERPNHATTMLCSLCCRYQTARPILQSVFFIRTTACKTNIKTDFVWSSTSLVLRPTVSDHIRLVLMVRPFNPRLSNPSSSPESTLQNPTHDTVEGCHGPAIIADFSTVTSQQNSSKYSENSVLLPMHMIAQYNVYSQ